MNNRNTGNIYEEKAAKYLEKLGYKILIRNFRGRQGEIDIIALDGRYLVFVEVKYRATDKRGDPAEAVTYYKQKRIRNTASYYMYINRYSDDTPCRFDVICITGDRVRLIKSAFE